LQLLSFGSLAIFLPIFAALTLFQANSGIPKFFCETNPIVSIIATQNAKTPYTYLCDAIRIAKVSQIVLFDWRRRVFTNAALRPGMPPCPSLWVVGGTSFTRSAALRNFNGGSPTSSTTD
jgi:hypothetical protein